MADTAATMPPISMPAARPEPEQEPFPTDVPSSPSPRPNASGEHHADDWVGQDHPLQRKIDDEDTDRATPGVSPPRPAVGSDLAATVPGGSVLSPFAAAPLGDSAPASPFAPPAAPLAPAVPPQAAAAPAEERTFYLTVLGKRIGPLSRSAARELKARELKGVLTMADLAQYPQA